MNTPPLVSVIIPVKDGEAFVGQAIESVLAQDHPRVELIVIDDGSEDGTASVVEAYPASKLIRQRSCGPAAARNVGIAASAGELITFLDADDVAQPQRVRVQAGYLAANPDVGAVLTRQEVFLEPGIDRPRWLRRDSLIGDELGVQSESVMVRRSVVEAWGGFDPSLRYAEGMEWLGRLRDRGVRVALLPDVLTQRRIHGRNMSHDFEQMSHGIFGWLRGRARRSRAPSAALHADEGKGPLVSVVIPVRDAASYLAESIDSVLSQSYRHVEVIVVDDGSTDGSAAVAVSYGAPVRCVRQDPAGISAGRNLGVRLARGELIAFLDADDRFTEGRLACQVAALERDPRLDAVFGHVREFRERAIDQGPGAARLRPPMRRAPAHFVWSMLIRREAFEAVGPFDAQRVAGEQIDWYGRLVATGARSAMLPDVVTERRLHTGSLMAGLGGKEATGEYVRALKGVLDMRRAAEGSGR